MDDLKVEGATAKQLIAIADGLAQIGEFTTAAELYRSALPSANAEQRNRLYVRLGIVSTPRPDRAQFMAALREVETFGVNVFVGASLITWNKTMPFCDDARFMALTEKHAALLPIPNWHWNFQTVLWAIQRTRTIEGDFVELGVFKGHTTMFLAEYVGFETWPKRWRLYDTFEGIPEDQLDPGWDRLNSDLYVGKFGVEEVRKRFSTYPNIDVIQGRVPEIFDTVVPEKIAFLHIDLNNSAAEIAALDALYDRISPGGVIIFDDYAWLNARAQYNAERKWFAARGLEVLPIPTGQGVFVKPGQA